MSSSINDETDRAILVARCHEIHSTLQARQVPEFEVLSEIGMALQIALNIRGLPLVDFEILKRVAGYFWNIPSLVVERILRVLAELEFVRLNTEGQSIKSLIPTVPYYSELYDSTGAYLETRTLNETEQLALELTNRLAKAPENIDRLRTQLGADDQLFNRGIQIGTQGEYILTHRCRGRNILLYPLYFSENAEIFTDHVAAHGSENLQRTFETLGSHQGWPLKLIDETSCIGEHSISPAGAGLLKRVARLGSIKPPAIKTSYSGENYFMFTPAPPGMSVTPTMRDIYEKAMAIVAAVRQGQLLPKRYAIRSPGAVLYKLKTELRLGKATTEATEQYRSLVHLRIGRLVPSGSGYHILEVIDTPENRLALDLAYSLVDSGDALEVEVDSEARQALQQDQNYIDSLVSSQNLRSNEPVALPPHEEEQLELLMLGVANSD